LAVVFAACAVPQNSSSPSVATSRLELQNSDCPASLPAALVPAADQALLKIFPAEGVQIYRCTLNATSGTASWVFDSPDALLNSNNDWDDDGDLRIQGHHFAGPSWEYKDRSVVVGTKVAAATVDATAIPWLLLTAASHSGIGLFTEVTSIQRLDTVGGNAPATGCDTTTVGAAVRVPYTATYFMYKTRAGDNSNRQCK